MFANELQRSEAGTAERRLSRAACGRVEELADYGCVNRKGWSRRAAAPGEAGTRDTPLSAYLVSRVSHAIQNPFATPEGARRYHQGRPFHHPRALDKIFEVVGLDNVPIALDVACGTGLSTIALVDHAQLVIGIDPVEAMLRVPPHRVSAVYVCAAAEHVPVPSRSVDVATVSSGIHWFHQDAFFTEMAQVLRPGGWLAIYDHFFR